jgi:copper transport protein
MKKLETLVLLGAVVLLLFVAPAVLAHANLVRSEPAANSAVKTSPQVVRLWFSEAIEPKFSHVTVVDPSQLPVDQGDSHPMSGDPTGLEISLKSNLPAGIYTVVWKTTSAVDGHVTAGSFPFAVGDVPIGNASPNEIMSMVDTALGNNAAPPLYQVVVRWLNVLLLALLVGGLTFPLLVLFPALRAVRNPKSILRVYADYLQSNDSDAPASTALAAWSPRWLRLTRLFWAAYAVVTTATLLAQAYTVSSTFSSVGTVLTATRFGIVWILRAMIVAELGILLFRARWQLTANLRANRTLWLAAGLGVLLALTQSLNSHGAAVNDPPVLPFAIDVIHLLGAIVWIGGLVQLIATLPALLRALPADARAHTLAETISAFSLVAFTAVGVILLSGAYSMVIQVGSLEAFFATLYGNTLLIKFVLIVPLLALGALNLIVNRHAYARASADRAIPFIHRVDVIVALEVIFAAAVLLVVGYLTSLAPAKSAYDPSSKLWLATHRADDLTVTLGIAPALAGTNDFDVKVQDASGQPVSNASVVRLNASMREMDMGIQQVAAQAQGNGHYTFHGDTLSMVGTWTLDVLVRRAGHDDVHTTFTLSALSQPAAQSAMPAALQNPYGQAGLGLTLLAFVIGTASVLLLDRRRARLTSLIGAVAFSVVGVLVLYQVTATTPIGQAVSVPVVPAFAHLQPDPVPPVPAQIEAGQRIYLQNCATCHGAEGKGDGPAAANLNPKPADLTVHAPLHTEGDLYWWVTHGISGTAMPAWESTLTDLQRWQVVTFVKNTFGAATPTPTAAPQSFLFVGHLAADLNVTLTLSSNSAAAQTFAAKFSDAHQQPTTRVVSATLELARLEQDGDSARVEMDAGTDGDFRASGNYLSKPGMWVLRVTAQRRSGEPVQAEFPFYQAGDEFSTRDPRARQILQQSDAAMNALTSLRAVQELNDGKFGAVTTHYEYAAPDRLRFQVSGGMESIAVAAKQFDRDNGTWSARSRVDPFVFPNFDNAGQASAVRLGRTDTLGGAPMQIIETAAPSGDETVHYAFWIGTNDHLVHQFAMVAPGHYMMQYYFDYNAPVDIQAPANWR